jgi:predicted acetyltransferase
MEARVDVMVLRTPTLADEQQVRAAQAELEADGFQFAFLQPDESWNDYVTRTEQYRRRPLPEPWVPATMFLAEVDGVVVGRVHVRHELNDTLLAVGGHIGYGVRPAFRRRGYASEMLRRALAYCRDEIGLERVLVTCDDDNIGSATVIENAGGVLENVVADGDVPKRRYWITLGSMTHDDGDATSGITSRPANLGRAK